MKAILLVALLAGLTPILGHSSDYKKLELDRESQSLILSAMVNNDQTHIEPISDGATLADILEVEYYNWLENKESSLKLSCEQFRKAPKASCVLAYTHESTNTSYGIFASVDVSASVSYTHLTLPTKRIV